MWNWIKYLPLEWRKQRLDCTPKGPTFGRFTPRIDIPIAGSHLRFCAPSHRPSYKEIRQRRLLPGSDALSHGIFVNYANGIMANEHWGKVCPFFRAWTFWGPWMTGAKAELFMNINILGRDKEHVFPNTSFFNPKAFETVLMTYLNDRYGHRQWENGVARHWGPAQWKTHDHLPVFSASCNIYRQDANGKKNPSPEHLFFFPITKEHFVEVSMEQDIYNFDHDLQPTFDTSPVQALQDSILNSMTLELSSDAQADYDRAKTECGDMQLTEHFPPLQWPTGSTESENGADGLRLRQA